MENQQINPHSVMENASELAQLAIRTCGGQAMLSSLPLEHFYRDSRFGAINPSGISV